MLIRNGEALQTASNLVAIVLDKTGTITKGKPELTDVIAAPGYERERVLELADRVLALVQHEGREVDRLLWVSCQQLAQVAGIDRAVDRSHHARS